MFDLRKAELRDIHQLNTLIHCAYRTNASYFTEAHLIISPRATLDSLSDIIHQKDALFYVYEVDGSVVGCIQIEEHKGICLLGQLAVHPSFQSKGIGRKLMEFALKVISEKGFMEAHMWVLEVRKDIIQWYEKLGFFWNGETLPFVHTDTHVPDLVFHVYIKKI